MISKPTIAVAGDISQDFNVYLPVPDRGPTGGGPQTRFLGSMGGAAIIQRLLDEVSRLLVDRGKGTIEVCFAAGCGKSKPTASPVAGLWQPQMGGKLLCPENARVWRLVRSIGLGDTSVVPRVKGPLVREGVDPRILVVEDDAGKFRTGPPACEWPAALKEPSDKLNWIVLKMTAPVCQGKLWWHLAHDKKRADRLVVVLPVGALRREDVRISRGISWERTAIEVARELMQIPSLVGLREARHVIVTLGSEGAVWMQRKDSQTPEFRLIFDPECMEGEFAEAAGIQGEAYGFISCFTAALVARMAVPADDTGKPGIEGGIERGLRVCRFMRLFGHGLVGAAKPGLPLAELARVITDEEAPAFWGSDKLHVDPEKLGRYGKATLSAKTVEAEGGKPAGASKAAGEGGPRRWRILEGADAGRPENEPLYGVARRVAVLGLRALRDAPFARFGKLVSADRDEIEALRNFKRLIGEYRDQKEDAKPLSLAVFGPPGAGKSFAIKEIVQQVLPTKTPVLEFNLSQFSDEKDLIGAFHQVRDRALEGFIPVVFWDEFDSQKYRWLQFLLAPMQDGKFQEGQITHPIGKCVFVFAGATSYDMKNFGPPKGDDEKAARDDFRLKKGPDFASRLHGFLDLLGPNRRQVCRDDARAGGRKWEDDPEDVCFPVRRAVMLRTMLGFSDERRNARLEIDHGLLAALLEVDQYVHGARSLQKVAQGLKNAGDPVIRRSALPSDEVLRMNVNLAEFRAILGRERDFQAHAPKLAKAIHDVWRKGKKDAQKGKPFDNDVEFEQLPDELKASNLAAAYRIPWILEMAGLYLVPKAQAVKGAEASGPDLLAVLEPLLDVSAEEEHIHWMEFMFANGWKAADPPPASAEEEREARKKRLHKCLIPFSKLDKDTQDYDRNQIRQYPVYADLAGFVIVASMPKGK
ncbi:MAG: ATP-binding protein [Planctomycetota bacterium]|nr:ATP-binding protein [Planctomycetota bacterium]